MRQIYILIIGLFLAFQSFAQTAQVQFFHNVPTLGTDGGPVFDVYINGTLNTQLTGFEFRKATSFLPIPAGFNIVIDIRQSPSTIMDTPLRTFFLDGFNDGEEYSVMISGILDDIGFLPDLAININEGAASSSISDDMSYVNMGHGGILLPLIKIGAKDGDDLFEADYGEFSEYAFLSSEKQFITVDVTGVDFPLTFEIDLEEREGDSGTIFVSGSAVNAPEWGLFIVYADGSVDRIQLTPVGYVQFLNLSRDTLIDIYVNNELLVDSLAMCEGSPYIFAPAEDIIQVGIAPGGSESADDIYAVFDAGFESDRFHQFVLRGERDNLDFPLRSDINREVPEEVASDSSTFNIVHAVLTEDTLVLSQKEFGTLIDTMVYDSLYGYHVREGDEFYLDLLSADDGSLIASFILPIHEDLLGLSFTLVIAEEDNEIVMKIIDENGVSQRLARLPYNRVQIINNSPGTNYDLYRNTEKIFDSLTYLSATPFLSLPAGIDQALYLVPAGSDSIEDFEHIHPYNNNPDSSYIFLFNGSMETEGEFEFEVLTKEDAVFETDDFNNTDFQFFHGIYDSLTISASLIGEGTVLEGLVFGQFSDYESVLSDIYFMEVVFESEENQTLTYEFDLSAFSGRGVTVLYHGSIEDSSARLISIVDTSGQFFPLSLSSIARTQIIHASPGLDVDIYLDSILYLEAFQYQNATSFLNLEADSSYHFFFTPTGAGSPDSAFYDVVFTPEGGREYVLIAAGSLDDEERPFDVFVNDNAQSSAVGSGLANLMIFHGNISDDDIDIHVLNADPIYQSVGYGTFSDYESFEASDTYWALYRPEDDNPTIVYNALLSDLSTTSSVVIYTTVQDTLELWAIRASGNLVTFPSVDVTRGQFIQNSPMGSLDIYLDRQPIIESIDFREASPFLFLPIGQTSLFSFAFEGTDFEFAEFEFILDADSTYIFFVTGVIEDEDFPFDMVLMESVEEFNESSEQEVLVNFIHGSRLSPQINLSSDPVLLEFDNVRYTDRFKGELIPSIASVMSIIDLGTDTIIDYYYVDLREFEGEAGSIWLSGFDVATSDDGLFMAFSDGSVIAFPKVGLAHIQVFNNSSVVLTDLAIDQNSFLETIGSLEASTFIECPAGIPVNLHFDMAEADDLDLEETFRSGESYIVILQEEHLGDSLFITPVIIDSVRRQAFFDTRTDLIFYNGVQDSGPIDVEFRNISQLFSGLPFTDHTDYFQLVTQNFIMDTNYELDGQDTLSTHLLTIDTLVGSAGVAVSSAINGDEQRLSWYLVLTDGEVIPLEEALISRVQFLNNALVGEVDIFVGEDRLLNNIDTREASGYLSVNTFGERPVRIQHVDAEGDTTILLNETLPLENRVNYIYIVNSIPDSDDSGISSHLIEDAFITTDPFTVFNTKVHHGAPITQNLSLEVVDGEILAENIDQGSSGSYSLLEPAEYQFRVILDPEGLTPQIINYGGDLRLLGGQSLIIFTSGDHGADGIGLYGLLPNGVVFPFEILVSTLPQIINDENMSLFPVPADNVIYLDVKDLDVFTDMEAYIIDVNGKVIQSQRLKQINNQPIQIDIHRLPSGFYNMQVKTDFGIKTIPFIKQ